MIDVTKLLDIQVGIYVKIKLIKKNNFSTGKVREVISKEDNLNGVIVLIDTGDIGHVLDIINNPNLIKTRILDTESHNSENKLNFYERVMQEKSIPQTIQSFLNSNGGYLYVGIYDEGNTISEKFRGLNEDKKLCEKKILKEKKLEPGQKLSDVKFMDEFRSDIEKTLDKFLTSDIPIGSLIEFEFPIIEEVLILEITIKKSPSPFFYRSLSKSNKPKIFQIYENGEKITERMLDTFYYRDGSRKIRIETFEQFHKFLKNRFN